MADIPFNNVIGSGGRFLPSGPVESGSDNAPVGGAFMEIINVPSSGGALYELRTSGSDGSEIRITRDGTVLPLYTATGSQVFFGSFGADLDRSLQNDPMIFSSSLVVEIRRTGAGAVSVDHSYQLGSLE